MVFCPKEFRKVEGKESHHHHSPNETGEHLLREDPLGRGRDPQAMIRVNQVLELPTGILAILIVLIPAMITIVITEELLETPIPLYANLPYKIFTVTFLLSFACYCMGLHSGWNSNRIAPTLKGFGLSLLLIQLLVIKGFGISTIALLVLIIAASLIRTWQKFISTSL